MADPGRRRVQDSPQQGPDKAEPVHARFGKGFFIPTTSMLLPYQRREDVAEA
jgi:hypothetical protein